MSAIEGRALAAWCVGAQARISETDTAPAQLMEGLEVQRVGPWLYHRLCRNELEVPAALTPLLRSSAARGSAQALLDSAVRKEVLGAMVHGGLHPVALKGTVLGPWLYGEAAWRPNHDLDVLLPPDEVAMGALILRKLGFRAVHRRNTPWVDGMSHERAFWRGDDLPVELHRHITQPRRFRVPLYDLFERSVQWEYGGLVLRRLSNEDQFLHLVIHAAHHKFLIPFIHWLDLYLLLNREVDLQVIGRRGAEFGMNLALAIVAERLVNWFDDERLLSAIGTVHGARRLALHGLLRPSLATQPTHGYADAWYALLLMEHPRNRILFTVEHGLRWLLDRQRAAHGQKSCQLRSRSGWRSWILRRLHGFSVLSSGRSGSPQASQ